MIALPAIAALLQFATPIQPGETETAQAGSTSRGGMVSRATAADLGVLRCATGQAMVGVRSSASGALLGVQLVCATLRCGADGRCAWSQGSYGGIVGQIGAGAVTQACPADSVATGFRASTAAGGAYVADVQIECGRASAAGAARVVRVAGGRTLTAHAVGGGAAGSCATTGATALTYAKGRLRNGASIVQAISFYCADRVPFRPSAAAPTTVATKPPQQKKPEAQASAER